MEAAAGQTLLELLADDESARVSGSDWSWWMGE
jgi:hypothetical protein